MDTESARVGVVTQFISELALPAWHTSVARASRRESVRTRIDPAASGDGGRSTHPHRLGKHAYWAATGPTDTRRVPRCQPGTPWLHARLWHRHLPYPCRCALGHAPHTGETPRGPGGHRTARPAEADPKFSARPTVSCGWRSVAWGSPTITRPALGRRERGCSDSGSCADTGDPARPGCGEVDNSRGPGTVWDPGST